MIVCSIVPNNVCEWMYDKQDVMLLLSSLSDKHYVDVALAHDEGCFKMLKDDTGEATIEQLWEGAKLVHASEIVLPWVELDGPASLDLIKESIAWLEKNGWTEDQCTLQAVCYGKDLEEFTRIFREIEQIPQVHTIGLPKDLSAWCVNSTRHSLIPLWGNSQKKIHWLGFWYSLSELLDMPLDDIAKLRGADTTLFALNAINTSVSVLEDRRGALHVAHPYLDLFREAYDRVTYEYYEILYDKASKEGKLGI